eukprot:GILK01011977.1.p1 GENE.GILK01011977.1~~GILK01011977.1.p1  ORF type:complete len:231 (+),score=29.45 GILK01011977.1:68-694(+)
MAKAENRDVPPSCLRSKKAPLAPHFRRLVLAVSMILEDAVTKIPPAKDKEFFEEGDDLTDLFREDIHVKDKQEFFVADKDILLRMRQVPTVTVIRVFVEGLFQELNLCESALISALIYIHRLSVLKGKALHPYTWRPLVLVAVILAHKMLEDVCSSNACFVEFYPVVTGPELLQLELAFCSSLNFKCFVSSSIYEKYEAELMSLVEDP